MARVSQPRRVRTVEIGSYCGRTLLGEIWDGERTEVSVHLDRQPIAISLKERWDDLESPPVRRSPDVWFYFAPTHQPVTFSKVPGTSEYSAWMGSSEHGHGIHKSAWQLLLDPERSTLRIIHSGLGEAVLFRSEESSLALEVNLRQGPVLEQYHGYDPKSRVQRVLIVNYRPMNVGSETSGEQNAVGAASGQSTVKSHDRATLDFGERGQPGVGPQLWRGESALSKAAKDDLKALRLIKKDYPLVFEKPIIGRPCLGHRQRATIHHHAGRQQAKNSDLGQPNKSKAVRLILPPPILRLFAPGMIGGQDSKPDIDVRESQGGHKARRYCSRSTCLWSEQSAHLKKDADAAAVAETP